MAARRPLTRAALAVLPVLLLVPAHAFAQQGDGFLPVRVDAERNRLLLEIPDDRMGQDFLYLNTLATGLGGGPPRLDRGQVGSEAVVRLERRGNRVLMVRDNWNVRALEADAAGERAAREAFPTSVVAVFPVDTTASREAGRTVVDASSFFFSDVFGVANGLRGANQGTSRVDRDRSWIDPELTRAFPGNTEIRAVLTFVGDQPGPALRRVAPDGTAATIQQHHSLVELPDLEDFQPRAFDTRAGLFATSFYDFSQGIDGTYRDAYVNRWRLVPRDRAAYLRGELVEPEEPIVFHLDPGIPEPYRTAFQEGAMWWNGIFEAAGFRNAFQLRELPQGADPLDARYNVLYWIHRPDPGPSVGPSFRDPRTGQILKTVVRMDSYRSLVDYNIYAGLLPAAGPQGLDVDAEEFAMARRRQHTAHEIGHTLGLAHNFISATQGRSSVMDYPAPLITLDGGRLNLKDAYRDGGGAWDSLAVRYAYTWFPDEAAEEAGLQRIMEEGLAQGLRFITGGHASAAGSIPGATQWVEGANMFEAVERTAGVRRLLIDRFNEEAVKPGEPLSMLNMRFAHVYLHHRYALEGLVKHVGGMDFTYALRGDGQTPTQILSPQDQRRALQVALQLLAPVGAGRPRAGGGPDSPVAPRLRRVRDLAGIGGWARLRSPHPGGRAGHRGGGEPAPPGAGGPAGPLPRPGRPESLPLRGGEHPGGGHLGDPALHRRRPSTPGAGGAAGGAEHPPGPGRRHPGAGRGEGRGGTRPHRAAGATGGGVGGHTGGAGPPGVCAPGHPAVLPGGG
jgi:hypothetical protein